MLSDMKVVVTVEERLRRGGRIGFVDGEHSNSWLRVDRAGVEIEYRRRSPTGSVMKEAMVAQMVVGVGDVTDRCAADHDRSRRAPSWRT